MHIDSKFILLLSISIGIVVFIASIVFRRKTKIRKALITLGIVFGLIPLLLNVAFTMFIFIKERPFVGNYEGDSGVQGMVSLDVFDDNTFLLKSDSCSTGFVQGTWNYSWSTKTLEFSSSSQRMGEVSAVGKDSLQFNNIPVCIKLVREMRLGRSGKPLVVPMEENNF